MSIKPLLEQNPDALAEYVCGAAFGALRGPTEFGSSVAFGSFRRTSGATRCHHPSRIEAMQRAVQAILGTHGTRRVRASNRDATASFRLAPPTLISGALSTETASAPPWLHPIRK